MDMLVSLYNLEDFNSQNKTLLQEGVRIVRAMAGDRSLILSFIKKEFPGTESWTDECSVSFFRQPVSCFIAVYQDEVIGFSCYDATAKGMLGPLGVSDTWRGKSIASVLVQSCLNSMKEEGYAYAVIGWVNSPEFYKKACNAVEIKNSYPGVYGRKIKKKLIFMTKGFYRVEDAVWQNA